MYFVHSPFTRSVDARGCLGGRYELFELGFDPLRGDQHDVDIGGCGRPGVVLRFTFGHEYGADLATGALCGLPDAGCARTLVGGWP